MPTHKKEKWKADPHLAHCLLPDTRANASQKSKSQITTPAIFKLINKINIMEKEVLLKWLTELEKTEKEQIDTFDKYQKEHPELIEWNQFFERLKEEFKCEMQKEKLRVTKLLNQIKNGGTNGKSFN